MSEHEHDDLEALFAAERASDAAPSDAVRSRIASGLRAKLAAAVPAPDPTAPAAPTAPADAASATSTGMSVARAVGGMISTFVIGTIGGALAMHEISSTKAVVTSSAVSSASAVIAPASPVPRVPPAEEVTPPAAVVASLSTAPVDPPPVTSERIAAERALLDAARVALSNGEPAEAIAFVDRHAKEFPHGNLMEERDALAVRALAKAGRAAEARALGARFKRRWPQSLALPAVNAALESLR